MLRLLCLSTFLLLFTSCLTTGIVEFEEETPSAAKGGTTYTAFVMENDDFELEAVGITTLFNLKTNKEHSLFPQGKDIVNGGTASARYAKLSLPPGIYAVVEYRPLQALVGSSARDILFDINEAPWLQIPKTGNYFYGSLVFSKNNSFRNLMRKDDFDNMLKERNLTITYEKKFIIQTKEEKRKLKKKHNLDNVDL